MERRYRKTAEDYEALESPLPLSNGPSSDSESISNIPSLLSHDGERDPPQNTDDDGEEHQNLHLEWKERANGVGKSHPTCGIRWHRSPQRENKVRSNKDRLAEEVVEPWS